MDALVKGLERRGYIVSVPAKQWHRGTIIAGFGDTDQLRLRELKLRQAHVPTAEEQKRSKQYPNASFVDRYDYVASGRLQLELMLEDGHFPLKSFRDGAKRKLEDLIADVPLAILRVIDHYRRCAAIRADEARQRAEVERQEQEEEEQRRLEAQRRKEEQQRNEALFVEAEQWARCRTLRSYLDAVRVAAIEKHGFIEKGSDLDQWLEWGDQVAGLHDPLGELEARAVKSKTHAPPVVMPKRPR